MIKRFLIALVILLTIASEALASEPLTSEYFSLLSATPVEIFNDPETGHEIWRMTDWDGYEAPAYYTQPQYSPNGRYIVFQSGRLWPTYLAIINSDGSDERMFGEYSQWSSYLPSGQNDLGDYTAGAWGWWGADSAFYYTKGGLFKVSPSTNRVAKVTTDPSKLPFNIPILSPDGRTLFGISNQGDISNGAGKLKFIDVDGSNYREFDAPYAPADTGFDVTHGWLGNNNAWYMNKDNRVDCCMDYTIVFDPLNGEYLGYLEVDVPGDIWRGLFSHITISADAYLLGNGAGLIAGHNREFQSANTKFSGYADPTRRNIPGDPSNNPTHRELAGIADRDQYPGFENCGMHAAYSPDGKWLVMTNVYTDCSKLALYPVEKDSSPVWLASYGPSSACGQDSGLGAYPTWSPDSTKVIFGSNYQLPDRNTIKANSNDMDIYVAIVKKPDAPTNLNADSELIWKPAAHHREIQEYEVYQADSQYGNYELLATVDEVCTYLEAPSKISASETTINVDSTVGFPASGVIEILGLSTEGPTELVAYTGMTATSFTGCIRGYGGTGASEHYNDAFVWRHTGYAGDIQPGKWYKVRAAEWSGLKSEFSSSVQANPTSTPESANTPEPTNTPIPVTDLAAAVIVAGGGCDFGTMTITDFGDGTYRMRCISDKGCVSEVMGNYVIGVSPTAHTPDVSFCMPFSQEKLEAAVIAAGGGCDIGALTIIDNGDGNYAAYCVNEYGMGESQGSYTLWDKPFPNAPDVIVAP